MDILAIVIGLIKSLKFIQLESGTMGIDSDGVFVVFEEEEEEE